MRRFALAAVALTALALAASPAPADVQTKVKRVEKDPIVDTSFAQAAIRELGG